MQYQEILTKPFLNDVKAIKIMGYWGKLKNPKLFYRAYTSYTIKKG